MREKILFLKVKLPWEYLNLIYSMLLFTTAFYFLLFSDISFVMLPFISLYILFNVYVNQDDYFLKYETMMLIILNLIICFVGFYDVVKWLNFSIHIFFTIVFSLFIGLRITLLNYFIGFRELTNMVVVLLVLNSILVALQGVVFKFRLNYFELFISKFISLIEVVAFIVFSVSTLIYLVFYFKKESSAKDF
ncbi:hypothetical protein LNQ81_14115 [Myroides sp. M-43]|uniref:hypothetical protein n=1 Tax=Myroides oncorhynchi TaxID=2893756 RepID=UPI001E5D429C|nr:hypothetical protein [Myroides oncorhynchi]MCC9043811.1 hypothetical protein [Myroides oncorhynchi]